MKKFSLKLKPLTDTKKSRVNFILFMQKNRNEKETLSAGISQKPKRIKSSEISLQQTFPNSSVKNCISFNLLEKKTEKC